MSLTALFQTERQYKCLVYDAHFSAQNPCCLDVFNGAFPGRVPIQVPRLRCPFFRPEPLLAVLMSLNATFPDRVPIQVPRLLGRDVLLTS